MSLSPPPKPRKKSAVRAYLNPRKNGAAPAEEDCDYRAPLNPGENDAVKAHLNPRKKGAARAPLNPWKKAAARARGWGYEVWG